MKPFSTALRSSAAPTLRSATSQTGEERRLLAWDAFEEDKEEDLEDEEVLEEGDKLEDEEYAEDEEENEEEEEEEEEEDEDYV